MKKPEDCVRILTFDFSLGSIPDEVRHRYVRHLYIGARYSLGPNKIQSSGQRLFLSLNPYNVDINRIVRLLTDHGYEHDLCPANWYSEAISLIRGYVDHIIGLYHVHESKSNAQPQLGVRAVYLAVCRAVSCVPGRCSYVSVAHREAYEKYVTFVRQHYPDSTILAYGQQYPKIPPRNKWRRIPTQ